MLRPSGRGVPLRALDRHLDVGPPRREAARGADARADRRHSGKLEELDVEGILAFAERILPLEADLWGQASVDQRQRFQQLFFPDGIAFDGNRFIGTGVNAPAFSYLPPIVDGPKEDGGPDGSRTRDLMNAIHARSQLRYRPTCGMNEPSVYHVHLHSVPSSVFRIATSPCSIIPASAGATSSGRTSVVHTRRVPPSDPSNTSNDAWWCDARPPMTV